MDSQPYDAVVLRHNLFEIQTASDHGIDAIPKISFTLSNADSQLSQIESAVGFKGAGLKATFLFYDLVADVAASEKMVVFQGVLNPPDEIARRDDSALGNQPHEYAAGATPPGTHSTPLSLGVSRYAGRKARGR